MVYRKTTERLFALLSEYLKLLSEKQKILSEKQKILSEKLKILSEFLHHLDFPHRMSVNHPYGILPLFTTVAIFATVVSSLSFSTTSG